MPEDVNVAPSAAQTDVAPTDTAHTNVAADATTPAQNVPQVESPPPARQPARSADPDPRTRLHQLAHELMHNRNRRLLIEFLQLRRALR